MRASSPRTIAVPPRLPVFYIHSDEQWDAVCSDVRAEILRYLTSCGPCSITELAVAMGTAADGLYHHIRLLVSAGLVRALSIRPTGRRPERLYDASADRIRLDVEVASGRNTQRLLRLLRATMRRAESIVSDAVSAGAIRLDEPIANTTIRSDSACLDEEDLARIQRHLAAIAQVFAAARGSNRGVLHFMTTVLSPLVRARDLSARPSKRLEAMRERIAQRASP